MKPVNVFVVDDDDIYQFTIKVTLRSIPAVQSTSTFADGAEALEYIVVHQNEEDKLPDIIFLDINMPVMDGFQFMEEFVELLPSLQKSIKVYMVSSSMDPKDIKKAKRFEEISDYLIKPLNSKDIKEIIAKL
ncbi:response regulator [Allomuricauda sp. ARW1Y1]|jgi:CheY-like chemotaxis protein|uniref:response regulator n=1 Tax=Flavobacteriaceae TaxID=49546 RepID=UPI0015C97C54|nr:MULTISPECIES: response regulator [unclassified Allomuricauda]MBO6532286.1 response regulator [Allomuricauda sp.]MBO6588388.1 response regulator [Allomuricauda sp.]MBO6618472.1 response regulator [Allomuricauda sp.]MBO6643926.1 response regulator [Allomuricauda sp.]MBO6746810.1 response regulator [Allomuricauda sp.]